MFSDKPILSDDLQNQPKKDNAVKGLEGHAHKQSTEPQAISKQDSKPLMSFSDAAPMVTPPSQQPMTDSQIQEWVVGPHYSQVGLRFLLGSISVLVPALALYVLA